MYWLTDEIVFNKLITLKDRGIDVQIILDESTPDCSKHLNAFIANDIIPIVSPTGDGIMHDKFVVIDNSAVWTGSANFTKTVLSPDSNYINDENIIIINSPIAAEQYSDAFSSIERTIITVYIQSIAEGDILPDWLIPLCQQLYLTNRHFKEALNESLPHFLGSQQLKLRSFFPEEYHYQQQGISSWDEEATPKQKAFLESRGINSKISKREASALIGKIIESEKKKRYSPY